jgi:hypothetical protein
MQAGGYDLIARFTDLYVVMALSRNLRKVRDTQYLNIVRQRLQQIAHHVGHSATDPNVYLVKYHGGRGRVV